MNKIIGLTGVMSTPSRTEGLVGHLTEAFVSQTGYEHSFINLKDFGESLPLAKTFTDLDQNARKRVDEIINADALIIGVPTWNAGYPGIFKHLFDLIPLDALVNKPVMLSATGGSDRHALMPEYQLRPLFTYLRTRVATTTLFATTNDFDGNQCSPEFENRMLRAVDELKALVH
ncbi:NAD(P)H-dependent oxidoreductase [Enterobacter sp. RHBSTW-00175]|uniref:NAD(P)H-dependent oxidoreductase n=1 Tax=unclassified Enterobacter TaxID=2608935 RepID=UPI0015E91996|nr:NAD(P)H-dependent oxidoreductase [Enterobacter sp. RHBSTW-00175]QMR78220.1 NAD(P)H-dependent oxidoreductase [Enterobacter sp. RHBSTW-00175]